MRYFLSSYFCLNTLYVLGKLGKLLKNCQKGVQHWEEAAD